MSADVFTELFAVCQCMPGPSSTQMSFALGTTKQGILGGLLSGILFQYPGAIMMTILGMTAHNWATPQAGCDDGRAGPRSGLAGAWILPAPDPNRSPKEAKCLGPKNQLNRTCRVGW